MYTWYFNLTLLALQVSRAKLVAWPYRVDRDFKWLVFVTRKLQ